MPETAIATLADDLLTEFAAAAADNGITLPARRYVHVGQVAFDCEQVVVSASQITRGRPPAAAGDIVRISDTLVVELNLWIVRKVPGLSFDGEQLPSVAELQAAGETLAADGWLMTVGMMARYRKLAGRCTSLTVTDTLSAGPEGGYGGWQTVLQVGL